MAEEKLTKCIPTSYILHPDGMVTNTIVYNYPIELTKGTCF